MWKCQRCHRFCQPPHVIHVLQPLNVCMYNLMRVFPFFLIKLMTLILLASPLSIKPPPLKQTLPSFSTKQAMSFENLPIVFNTYGHFSLKQGGQGSKMMFGHFQRSQWAWITAFYRMSKFNFSKIYYNFNFGNSVGSLINF